MLSKNVVFFGSSKYFSALVLEKLVLGAGPLVLGVTTAPDAPAGRGLKLIPNPVKLLAQKHNIPIFETMNDYRMPTNDNGMTIGLVAAFGKIIPKEILDKFNGQVYNIHPSLLPKYRGPSPLQQQILDKVTETGVSLIQLDAQMDHGPIVAQAKETILPEDTWLTLGNRLFEIGANLFIENLFQISNFKFQIQDDNLATYTRKLTRADGFIPWEQFQPEKLGNKFRAYHHWPGVWTIAPGGKRLKLISISPQILVQPEGKSPTPYSNFHPL